MSEKPDRAINAISSVIGGIVALIVARLMHGHLHTWMFVYVALLVVAFFAFLESRRRRKGSQ